MKRNALIAAGFALLAYGQAVAATISVTKPTATDVWVKGAPATIEWVGVGGLPPTLSILLRDAADTTTVQVIINHTPSNPASYQWPSVPTGLTNGQYRVRVQASPALFGTSAAFMIRPFTVTSPNGGESWQSGVTKQITWTPGPATGTVKIELYRNGTALPNKVGVIIPSVLANAGTYGWTVGTCQSCPAQSGAGYQVMVTSTNPTLQDVSDNPFTIAPQGQQSGGFHVQPGQVAQSFAELRILEPTKASQWTIGTLGTVRWNAAADVKFPLWVFLVSADHKVPIDDMGKIETPIHSSQMQWKVADNLYDGQYCVRITSADNKVQVHSQPFHIAATKIVTFKVAATNIANKVHWHNWTSYTDWGEGAPFTTAHLVAVPDPGPTVIKYGYQRWYEDDGNHGYIIHRSLVPFNLAGVISQLKQLTHTWTVKSAFVNWVKASNSPQACVPVIFCLDAAMPNVDTMFGDAFAAFPKHPLPGDQPTQVQMAQTWLGDPAKNYGLVVIAQNEGQTTENRQCVQFASNVEFEVNILEQLTK